MPDLDTVKTALRLRTTAFDVEVQGLIDAAVRDLRVAGVLPPSLSDPLVERAVILYAKAHFGYTPPADAERFERAYGNLKTTLCLAEDYHAVE